MVEKAIISDFFTGYLRKGRDEFNALFAKNAALHKSIHMQSFTDSLTFLLNGIIRNKAHGSITYVVFQEYYETALRITEKRLLESNEIYENYRNNLAQILTLIPQNILCSPLKFIPPVMHALKIAHSAPAFNMQGWKEFISALTTIAPNTDTFMKALFVSAWRHGVAQYRDASLQTLATLPDNITASLFGIANANSGQIARYLSENVMQTADSMRFSSGKYTVVKKTIGGFLGFGGEFKTPPEIFQFGDKFFLADESQFYRVYADGYGHNLIPDDPEEEPSPSQEPSFRKAGHLNLAGSKGEYLIRELGYGNMATNRYFGLITFPVSHKVMLFYEKAIE